MDGQAGSRCNLQARIGGGAQGMLGQHAAISITELDHQFFTVIVCDQSNIHIVLSFSFYGFIKG